MTATPEEKLEARKRHKAWSIESRRRAAALAEAANERYRAMYDCRRMGIPLDTIAHDGSVDRSFVSRKAAEYARRHDLPEIKGPRYASTIEREAAS